MDDIPFLIVVAAISAAASLAACIACFHWFRREQRHLQKKILHAIADARRHPDEFFLVGGDAVDCGELVARFKVNQGKHTVSLLEADGKRFIHVDGELTAPERARMVRYLKSEGFMS